jgi:hypothetical protein
MVTTPTPRLGMEACRRFRPRRNEGVRLERVPRSFITMVAIRGWFPKELSAGVMLLSQEADVLLRLLRPLGLLGLGRVAGRFLY